MDLMRFRADCYCTSVFFFVLWLLGCWLDFLFGLTGELGQHGSKHKEEVTVLHKSISALDREKDVLQDEVDQKTEKLVVLQEELSKKVVMTDKPHQDYKLLLKYSFTLKKLLVPVIFPPVHTGYETVPS